MFAADKGHLEIVKELIPVSKMSEKIFISVASMNHSMGTRIIIHLKQVPYNVLTKFTKMLLNTLI